MSTKPLVPKKPVDTSDDETDDEDQTALDMALTSIGAIALVNGMTVYNDYKLEAIQGYDGEIVQWVSHPELSGEGPCEYCDNMDTEQFQIDDAPDLPAHVNCMCELAFVSDTDTEDLMGSDEFVDYQAWRESSQKALKLLLKAWTEGVIFAKKTDNNQVIQS